MALHPPPPPRLPNPLSDENTHLSSSLSSVASDRLLQVPSSTASTSSVPKNTLPVPMLHRTITKSASIQSLRHKFSTGSLFGKSKGKDQESALQILQGLFERPSRRDLREEAAQIKKSEWENTKETTKETCDCVTPCLCDVLGKELGRMGGLRTDPSPGRDASSVQEHSRESGQADELEGFLIELEDELKAPKGLQSKLKGTADNKLGASSDNTTLVNLPIHLNGVAVSPNRRHSSYEPLAYNPALRPLRHKVGSVQPTQSISNVSATGTQFLVPSRPRPTSHYYRQPPLKAGSSQSVRRSEVTASIPESPSSTRSNSAAASHPQNCPQSGSPRGPLGPLRHQRTTSSSSLLTLSTISLTSYLSGTTSTASSRPATPNDTDSVFAKEYVSFPPYRPNSPTSNYTNSFEDVGKWVGGMGRRLTRRIRKGDGNSKTSEDEGKAQDPSGETKRGRGGRK